MRKGAHAVAKRPNCQGPHMAQSSLWPKKRRLCRPPKGGGHRLRHHVAGRAHRRPPHHHPAPSPEQAAKAEDMRLDVEELTLPQDGDSKMDGRGPRGQDVLPLFYFPVLFSLGATGSRRWDGPTLTAGHCKALRKIAGRGKDYGSIY